MLFALLLPLFLLAGLGRLLARAKWQAGLTELTAKVLIPALLFNGAFKNGIPASVSWQFLAAFFIALFALFLALRLWCRWLVGLVRRRSAPTACSTHSR